MNEMKMRKKTKAFIVFNIILTVYIFSLAIGYSLFSETLNINGTASIDSPNLDTCPLELREVNRGDAMIGSLGADGFRRFFLEKQDYNLLYTNNDKDNLSPSTIIDYYDSDNSTYNLLASSSALYPNSKSNTTNMCENDTCYYNEYKTLSKPIYFILENKTAYTLKNFILEVDDSNYTEISSPLENIDIRWKKFISLSDVYDTILNNDEISTFNTFKSALELSLSYTKQDDYLSSYSYNDFNNKAPIYFTTDEINTEEFLVLALYFSDIKESNYDFKSVNNILQDVERSDDGINFKFYEEQFTEKSAFKMRFAFKGNSMVKDFYSTNMSSNFYTNTSSNKFQIDWWN